MTKESIEIRGDCILININPKIYSLDVVYSAAYVFLEKAYILLEGDPEKELIINLKSKESLDEKGLEKLGREFLNELINYSFYQKQSNKNSEIRKIILQRALLTNDPFKMENLGDLGDLEGEEIDDSEEIAIPWEEKYGKTDGNE